MNITWLGQAGLLFETENIKLMVDPYLSDSVSKINPQNYRRVPVDENFFNVEPDVIILTHDHLDHTDPETLCHYLKDDLDVCVLASANAWKHVRETFGGNRNYVLFNRYTEWTQGNVKLRAVKAEHSDETAIGVIIEADNKKYYITGDTLYNTEIFKDLPTDIDYIFIPVNGVGNNMNMIDAERFCNQIGGMAIPLHCGLFDEIDMNLFGYKNKVIPQIYQKIEI